MLPCFVYCVSLFNHVCTCVGTPILLTALFMRAFRHSTHTCRSIEPSSTLPLPLWDTLGESRADVSMLWVFLRDCLRLREGRKEGRREGGEEGEREGGREGGKEREEGGRERGRKEGGRKEEGREGGSKKKVHVRKSWEEGEGKRKEKDNKTIKFVNKYTSNKPAIKYHKTQTQIWKSLTYNHQPTMATCHIAASNPPSP